MMNLQFITVVLGLVFIADISAFEPAISADCVISSTSTTGLRSDGGVLMPGIKSSDDCLSACTNAQECQGVDVDEADESVECYVHFHVADFDTSIPSSSSTQIRMARCPEEGIYLCNPLFPQTEEGQFSPGGTLSAEANTLDTCKYACQDSAPGCVGFDYHDDNTCYLHTEDTFGKNLNLGEGSNQYKLAQTCDTVCNPKWIKYENIHGDGAVPAPVTSNGKNISVCLEFCLRDRSCVGVEFTPGDNTPCMYYKPGQEAGMKQYQIAAVTTQYQLVDNCASHCNTDFTMYPGERFYIFHPRDVVASNAAECQNQCIVDTMCTAYEYTTSGPFVCTVGWNRIDYTSTPDDRYTSGRFVTPICTDAA